MGNFTIDCTKGVLEINTSIEGSQVMVNLAVEREVDSYSERILVSLTLYLTECTDINVEGRIIDRDANGSVKKAVYKVTNHTLSDPSPETFLEIFDDAIETIKRHAESEQGPPSLSEGRGV